MIILMLLGAVIFSLVAFFVYKKAKTFNSGKKPIKMLQHLLYTCDVKEDDLEALSDILSTNMFDKPTIKMSVYKNRRGRYKGIILWCKADLGCCRVNPMFATTYDYELIALDDIKITVEEESAF